MIILFRGRKLFAQKERICIFEKTNNQVFFVEEDCLISFLADNFCDELEDATVNIDDLSNEDLRLNNAVLTKKLEKTELDIIIKKVKNILY